MVSRRNFFTGAAALVGAGVVSRVGAASLPELVSGIADLATEHDVTVAVIAHAGDGNTHPLIVYDPADTVTGTLQGAAR